MYSKMALLAAARVGQQCRYTRSSLSVEKKLSATALSQQLPGRLRLERMPWLSSTLVYASEVYWADSTGRRNTSMRRCRDGTATRVGNRPNRTACNAIAWSSAGGEA